MRFLESLLMGEFSREQILNHEQTERDKEEARVALEKL